MHGTTSSTVAQPTARVSETLTLGNQKLYAVALLLSITPLWFPKYLPLADIPQQAGQIVALQQIWAGDPTFNQLFTVNWFTPYLIGYMLFYPVSLLVPVTVAAKVVVSIAVVSVPLLTGALLRTAGADERWKWLAIPASYGFAFYWGFLSFIVAVPIALLFLIRTILFTRAPTLRNSLVIVLFGFFLFFSHAIALGAATLLALAYVVGHSYREPRELLIRILPYAAPAPLIALWMFGAASEDYRANGFWAYGPPSERLFQLIAQPGGNEAIVLPITGVVVACVVLLPWLCGSTFSRQPQRWLPFAVALVLFLAMPSFVFGTAYVYQRLGIFLVPLWLLAWDAPQGKSRRLDWVAMLVVVWWTFSNAGRFAAFGRETQSFDAAMASVEPGRRVASMISDYRTPLFHTPIYMNFPAWYQATGRGVVDFNVGNFFNQLVRYRPDAGPRMTEATAWDPRYFDWDLNGGARYDYFIVKSNEDVAESIFKDKVRSIELVAHQGWWWLYRNNEREANPVSTDAAAEAP